MYASIACRSPLPDRQARQHPLLKKEKKCMKRIISAVLALVLCLALFAGCGSSGSSSGGNSGGTLNVLFWSAPNQNQFDYWQSKAEAFNATKTEYNGKVIQVTVEMTPETDSSEAAIQNAIATGTVPAASENINSTFMRILAESSAIYELQDEPIYQQIVKDRVMGSTVDGWAINGKQYVIPLYINSVTLIWNVKALAALGFDAPPVTMEDYYDVIRAYKDNQDKMEQMGVIAMLPGARLLKGSGYQCGYDFQMQYSTFTQGGTWLTEDALTVDRDAMIKTMEFWGALGSTAQLNAIDSPWTQENIPVLFDIGKPWDLSAYTEAGKVYGEDYVFATTPVEKAGDQAYCYADTKGITFYKASNITEELHQGALAFIGWVYSAENAAQSDLDWIEATAMLPVRADISENAAFADILAGNPALAYFGSNITNAVQLPAFSFTDDVNVAFRAEGLIPYITEAVTHEALDTLDASAYADAAIAAMKEAGKLN